MSVQVFKMRFIYVLCMLGIDFPLTVELMLFTKIGHNLA